MQFNINHSIPPKLQLLIVKYMDGVWCLLKELLIQQMPLACTEGSLFCLDESYVHELDPQYMLCNMFLFRKTKVIIEMGI